MESWLRVVIVFILIKVGIIIRFSYVKIEESCTVYPYC